KSDWEVGYAGQDGIDRSRRADHRGGAGPGLALAVALAAAAPAAADPFFLGLGDLPGGSFWSEARGVSADGSTVIGFSLRENGQEAFRWTEAGGMVGLGVLPGGFASEARG